MAKHVAYESTPDGRYFICQLDKGVFYGPCVHCNSHVAKDGYDFCRAIQHWDTEDDCYVLSNKGVSHGNYSTGELPASIAGRG